MKTLVLCGGHLTPALALIDYLKTKKDYQVIFFGRKTATEGVKDLSVESKTITKLGIPFVAITTGRLQRKFTRFTIFSLARIPFGFMQSLYHLIKFRPDLIISFGGYLSTPVVFSGWLLGIDSISHEQAVIPGLATKINSLFSKKVYLTWETSQRYFDSFHRHLFEPEPIRSETHHRSPQSRRPDTEPPDSTHRKLGQMEGSKFEVIGNLTRKSVFFKKAKDNKINQFLKKSQKLIFITGGNQGSHFLNQITFDILPKLKNYLVIHQVGTTNWQGDLDQAKKIKNINYLARGYFDDDNIGRVLQKADLVISRSGANTVWDLAICAKVAILIPLPISAGGEQEVNAQILKEAGSAKVLNQKGLTFNKLLSTIDQIFNNLSYYQTKAAAFSKTLSKDATEKVAKYIDKNSKH